jgi:hypothetical protein
MYFEKQPTQTKKQNDLTFCLKRRTRKNDKKILFKKKKKTGNEINARRF